MMGAPVFLEQEFLDIPMNDRFGLKREFRMRLPGWGTCRRTFFAEGKARVRQGLLGLLAVLCSTSIAWATDVQISQFADSPDPAVRGGTIVYTLNVENNAGDTAHGVVLTLPLPADTTFVSATGGGTNVAGTITWNLGDLLGTVVGGPVRTVTATLRTTAVAGATINATATVTTADADTNPSNDSLSQTTTIDDGADLVLAKSGTPNPVIAGANVTWTLDVTNNGPNDAVSLTVTDTLPANMSYVSSSGSGWTINRSGQIVTCTRAALANGATAPTISIVAKVTGAVTGTLTNTATATAATSDPNPNNTVTANVTVTTGTDLSIGKSVSPNPVLSGTNATFTLTPRNSGPFAASSITVTDTLPAGLVFISAGGTGWTCVHDGSPAGGTVTCTRDTYAVAATDDITLVATAPEVTSVTASANSASIASVTADPSVGNNTTTLNFSIVPDGVDLSLTKTKGPSPVAQGRPITSTFVVHNHGPQAAASGTIVLSDTLSAGETYVSASGTNWACVEGPTGTITCTYNASLANGANAPTLTLTTTATTVGTLTNNATISYSGAPGDWNATNNLASAAVLSTASAVSADLVIAKTASTFSGDKILQQDEDIVTYDLVVTNNGPGSADGVVVRDMIPAHVSGTSVNVSVTANTSSATFTCVPGSTVVCTQNNTGSGSIAVGESVTFTVTASRPLLDGDFTNTATVSSTTLGDPSPVSDNTASDTITIHPIADVQMQSKVVLPSTVKAGVNATYVITFRNNGPSPAQNVVVTDLFDLPSDGDETGFTFVSATASKGSVAGLAPGTSYVRSDNPTLVATVGSLTSGESQTLTVVIRPNWKSGAAQRLFHNTASITTDTWENSANTDNGNNSILATLMVDPAAVDVLVNVTDSTPSGPDPLGYIPVPMLPADNFITYQVSLTNRGPSMATGVTFTDTIAPPAGKILRFKGSGLDAAGAIANTLNICNNVDTTTTGPASLVITGTLDVPIPANTTVNRYLAFRVESAPNTGGDTVASSVTVASSETDSNAANNTEGETTTVRVRADLRVTKTPSINPVQLREPFDWTIVVTNLGPGDSAQTTLSDTLPTGMVFSGATPSWTSNNATPTNGLGSISGQTLSCNFGLLEAGKSVTLTVPVRVNTFAASYTNTATATTSEVDPDSSNNTSVSSVVTVQRSSLTGTVYRDLNNSGTIDAGETGIGSPTVTLRLTGTDAYGNAVNVTANTNASGVFTFNNLSPSDATGYTLVQTAQPAGFFDGQDRVGTSGGTSAAVGSDSIGTILLARNTAATGYLFGELPPNALSGFVYADTNNDGVKDGGEAVIAGATLTLTGTNYGADGLAGGGDDTAVNQAATTNASGQYTFSNLRAGIYTLTETQPGTHLDGKETLGSLGGSAADNVISNITLTTFGLSGTAYNFGELVPASLSGNVFIDQDSNAAKDPGETSGIPGLTMTLTGTDDLGATVNTTVLTTGNGQYAFNDLRPGTYTVTQTAASAGLSHTGAQVGSLGGSGQPSGTPLPGPLVKSITGISLFPGNVGTGYNFGESGQGLSGFVYADLNTNGVKDAGEPGIPGVVISLSGLTADGVTSVCAAIFPNPCTATTDASGAYVFTGIPASNGGGYTLTEQPQALAPLSNYGDGQESAGSLSGTTGSDLISAIVLGAGQFGSDYNFGERGASVGGRVYLDANNDGTLNGADTGIAGVTLALAGNTASGADVRTIIPSFTTVTAADGTYAFMGLPASGAGGYALVETQPLDYASRSNNLGNAGGLVGVDTFTAITLGAGANGSNYHFGEKTGTLSGFVYLDTSNDGVKDSGENGIESVAVRLAGTTAGGAAVNVTVATAADGSYAFDALRNGTYTLTETQPTGYLDGKIAAPTGVATVANTISAIPFSAAATFTGYTFGEVQAAGIRGRVYHDANSNASYDAGEELPGVTITLNGSDDQGTPVNQNVATATDGTYLFTSLRPSDGVGYTVTETQPAGIGDFAGSSGTQVGTINGTTTGVAALNQITGITAGSGVNASEYNFRDSASSLAGFVYLDTNNNGVKDAGETGIAGVTVTLTGTDASGSVNRTALTASDGGYNFIRLTSGTYALTETQPVIYQNGLETPGSVGGSSAQNQISAIALPAGTTATSYLFGELTGLAGSFSGKVWYNSVIRDQVQQPGESGLAGWHVSISQGGTLRGSTDTATDGTWSLGGLAAGVGYEIVFHHPRNNAAYGTPVSQDSGYADSVPNYAARTIANMTLRSGGTIVEQNLPVDPSGVVYDAITRTPVAGATVSITGPGGFNAAAHLLGGTANQSQVTDATGFYQFLLLPGAPAGTYALAVNGPAVYVPGTSSILPPAVGPLNPGSGPGSYEVQTQTSAPSGTQPTLYYMTFSLDGMAASIVNNHLPVDPILGGALVITKTTPKVNVTRGELVPYTIQVRNTLAATLTHIDLLDEMPPGLKYRPGSARMDGVPLEPVAQGRTLRWPNLTLAANQVRTLTLLLVVGSGVGEGDYTNRAWALNSIVNTSVSNIAQATIRIVPDPTFDCTDVIGKVFDDKNINGYQDQGEPGIPNVVLATVNGRLVTTDAEGRFHVACADIPQMDHGSNFIMKLDERTLPSGFRVTTENPHVVRATRGKMIKMNFGAAIHRVVRLELSAEAFDPGTQRLKPEWAKRFAILPGVLAQKPSVLRLVYRFAPQEEKQAQQRLETLTTELKKRWKAVEGRYPLPIEQESVEVKP